MCNTEPTTQYVTLLHHVSPSESDKYLKKLVKAGVDCYVDEKRNVVCHPDQWNKATETIMLNF